MHLAVVDQQNYSCRLVYSVDSCDIYLGPYTILSPDRHGILTVLFTAKICLGIN
jgi:hypothetical protein